MYSCPRCDQAYPKDTPAFCTQCKRPLVVNDRYRIGNSVEVNPLWGEDFDATDLKSKQSVILRELRVRKADPASSRDALGRYNANVDRLKRTKFSGEPVLLNAFQAEFKNSVCYYMVFNEDAWATLGNELYEDDDSASSSQSASAQSTDDLDLGGLDDLDNILSGTPPKAAAKRNTPPSSKAAPAPAKAPSKAPAKPADDLDDPPANPNEDVNVSDDDLAFLEQMLGNVDGAQGAQDDVPDYLKDLSSKPAKAGKDAGKAPGKAPGTALAKAPQKDQLPAKKGASGGALARLTPVQKAATFGGLAVLIAIIVALLL
jgi:hypothetical protein